MIFFFLLFKSLPVRSFLPVFLAALFSAVSLLPTWQLQQMSPRSDGLSYETVTSYPYTARHLLTMVSPYYFGSPGDGSYQPYGDNWGIFWENTAYLGIIPLVLAFCSLLFLKDKRIPVFLGLAFVSLLLMLGKYSPLYFIFSSPPFNYFRLPSRYILIFAFSLAVLSGLVLDKIFHASGKLGRHAFIISFIIGILVFLSDGFRFSYGYPPVSEASSWLGSPPVLKLLPPDVFRIKTYGSGTVWNEVFLKNGWQNPDGYLGFRNFLYPNLNAVYGIPSASVNTGGLIPGRTAFWQNAMENTLPSLPDKILSLWGVNTIISAFPLDHPNWSLYSRLEYRPEQTLYVYRSANSRPPLYFAGEAIRLKTLPDLNDYFAESQSSAAGTVFTDSEVNLEFSLPENSRIKTVLSENLVKKYEVYTDSKALLVFNMSFYPGWKITMDELPVSPLTVNLNQPAQIVPRGNHRLELTYDNEYFNLGKTVSAVSVFIAFLGAVLWPSRLPGISSTIRMLYPNRKNTS